MLPKMKAVPICGERQQQRLERDDIGALDESASNAELEHLREKVIAICIGDDDFWLDFRVSLLLRDSSTNTAGGEDDNANDESQKNKLKLRNNKEYFQSVTRRAYAYQKEKLTTTTQQPPAAATRPSLIFPHTKMPSFEKLKLGVLPIRGSSTNSAVLVEDASDSSEPSPFCNTIRGDKPIPKNQHHSSRIMSTSPTTLSVLEKASWLVRQLSIPQNDGGGLLVDFPEEKERVSHSHQRTSCSGTFIRSRIFASDSHDSSSFLSGANEDLTWAIGLSSPVSSLEISAASTFGRQRLFRRLTNY